MLDEQQACLRDDFDIEHSTIQFESERHRDDGHAAHA